MRPFTTTRFIGRKREGCGRPEVGMSLDLLCLSRHSSTIRNLIVPSKKLRTFSKFGYTLLPTKPVSDTLGLQLVSLSSPSVKNTEGTKSQDGYCAPSSAKDLFIAKRRSRNLPLSSISGGGGFMPAGPIHFVRHSTEIPTLLSHARQSIPLFRPVPLRKRRRLPRKQRDLVPVQVTGLKLARESN